MSRAALSNEITAAANLAGTLADAAGGIISGYFRRGVAIEDKADASPVTIADRESEATMRQLISQKFPHHGVVGEEYGEDRPDAEWVWVLDPIDGTKSFICGVPLFGTLIALLHEGRPVIGVLDQPILRERWLGVADQPSTFNGAPIRTRACASLSAATVFTTAPEMFHGPDRESWQRVSTSVKLARYGLDCYAYGLLAMGFCDAVVEADLKSYDFCAHIPIITGAGGLVTGWDGAPAGLASDGRIIAAGDAALHARLCELVAG